MGLPLESQSCWAEQLGGCCCVTVGLQLVFLLLVAQVSVGLILSLARQHCFHTWRGRVVLGQRSILGSTVRSSDSGPINLVYRQL